MKDLFEQLLQGSRLSKEETARIFEEMFAGNMTEAQIALVLSAWRIIGESGLELATGGHIMRSHATPVGIDRQGMVLVDNCGTGGDGSNSFNISTASAITAAACGVKMAKHGNRSVSSKCGSADLLFAAGFPDQLTPEQSGSLLIQTGFTFFFAPSFHPVMKYVMPVRKSLGVRTIFNLLGPLANPIAPEVQLIGVGDKKYLRPMAEALLANGVQRGMVVHSRDGMDEISPESPTDYIEIRNGSLTEEAIDPAALGISGKTSDLAGGDANHNLDLLHELLDGADNTILKTVSVNAGAVIYLSGNASSIEDGTIQARDVLINGKVKSNFANILSVAQGLAQ